ncbi:GNAT family N-acetyltransferase [Paenibacillus sp. FJAT-26967]|uniref:GNAT family N-acetyltransferase n=1 Tax=Paenibacillus sp. FJAT-26967 TaxID=1729690 RepID=UPI000838DE09|nr:GNAT family protein [Paenibacillus sp. FJAT-26967]
MFTNKINDHLELRLLEPRYAEELFRLIDHNRGYLKEWLPWVDGTMKVEDSQAFISASLQTFANNGAMQLGIFYQNKLAGCIGLHGIDRTNKSTSIGYWLGAEFQGHGIMTDSCRALVNFVFAEYGLNRIEIRASEFNAKSRAIPERLHFVQEGCVRQSEWLYDRYVDHIIYGLLQEEWAQTLTAEEGSDESFSF